MMRTVAAMIAACWLCAVPAEAQRANTWRGLEVWGGIAEDSPSWGVLGEVPRMNLAIVGLRFSRQVGTPATDDASRVTEFTMDLVPFAMTSPPYISLRGTAANCSPRELCVLRPPTLGGGGRFPNGSVRGIGFNPAGITTRFRANTSFSPSVGIAVGGLWFNERVPTTQASYFNFTAALEAGVRLGPPEAKGLTVTYRFHHISNAGTAGENPGLASHVLGVGIHLPRARREPRSNVIAR